jgi:hypothetical protein
MAKNIHLEKNLLIKIFFHRGRKLDGQVLIRNNHEEFRARVARWFVSKPKIPIWVNFGGPYIEWKMLVYFVII